MHAHLGIAFAVQSAARRRHPGFGALLPGRLLRSAAFLSPPARRTRRQRPRTSKLPGVTVLKPLKGLDVDLYRNLSTFCEQDYPEFQILFGVADADDPAVRVVRQLQAAYPGVDIDLVIDRRVYGTNYKVSNLHNMYRAAKHDVIVIADSDIRVGRDYLRRLAAELQRPGSWPGDLPVSGGEHRRIADVGGDAVHQHGFRADGHGGAGGRKAELRFRGDDGAAAFDARRDRRLSAAGELPGGRLPSRPPHRGARLSPGAVRRGGGNGARARQLAAAARSPTALGTHAAQLPPGQDILPVS